MSEAQELKRARRKAARQRKKAAKKVSFQKPSKVVVVEKTKGNAAPRKRKKQRNPGPPMPPSTVAEGSGAYRLTGDVSWGIPGLFSGRLGGYTGDDYVRGNGAYKVKKNSLSRAIDLTGTVPRVVNRSDGEIVTVSHREYLKDIKSSVFVSGTESTRFELQSFSLNPSNVLLFPWLAQIAANFQEYEVTGMLVEYKTTCSDLSTTLSLGTVILTADYNVLAAPPENKITMENMENAGSSKPSVSLIMPIECAPRLTSVSTRLFVGPMEAEDGDLRLYDMCNIFLATVGIPKEEVTIGELWVTYEVSFYKPKLLLLPTKQEYFSWIGYWSFVTETEPMLMTSYVESPTFHNSPLITVEPGPLDSYAIHFPKVLGQKFLVTCNWRSENDLGLSTVPSIVAENLVANILPGTGSPVTYTNPDPAVAGLIQMSMSFILTVTNDQPELHSPFFYFDDDGDYSASELTVFVTLINRDYEPVPVSTPHIPTVLFKRPQQKVERKSSRSLLAGTSTRHVSEKT